MRSAGYGAALVLSLAVFGGSAGAGQLPALPPSLADWYKPRAERQVWLHLMFSLRRELQAVEEYAVAGEPALTGKWAERLLGHYAEIAERVPEWSDELDREAADALRDAVRSGDLPGVLRAARKVGQSCDGCHREYRSLAAARFRSPDFSGLRLPDAVGGEIRYVDAMQSLSIELNRIKIASEDGRWDGATAAHEGLAAGLERLGHGCSACHDDTLPRERFLGAETGRALGELRDAIAAHDARATGRLLGEAAVKVCARCHAVHRTLADLRDAVFD